MGQGRGSVQPDRVGVPCAYTSATKTLVKLNAFTANKVNHWLYLESNDGGSIVAGYYKIATWTDASTVILATDAGGGVDDDAAKCTQHDGTTSLPYRSVQGALDLTTRNATDGDQINVKAGTAQVNQAALTLATYGTPTAAAPLVFRGYTSAANDGGKGEINCNSVALFAVTTYDYLILVDLYIHNAGNVAAVVLDQFGFVYRCEITRGAGSPSSKALVTLGIGCVIVGCYVWSAGTNGTGIALSNRGGAAIYNHVYACTYGISYSNTELSAIIGNVIRCTETGSRGISGAGTGHTIIIGNSVYNSAAGTAQGILLSSTSAQSCAIAINNIVEGWSGAGGSGVLTNAGFAVLLGWNATYNNTTGVDPGKLYIDETANDDALGASAWVNAGTGDFDINGTVAGVTEDGYPGSFHTLSSTAPKVDKGAVQAGAGAGGRPAFGDRTGGKF